MRRIIYITILLLSITINSCSPSKTTDDPNESNADLNSSLLGLIFRSIDLENLRKREEQALLETKFIVSMPTGLIKTGQTIVYQTWDDGSYQKGNARTLTVMGTTGLLWQRCSAGLTTGTCSGYAKSYSWSQAISYCNTLSLGGKTWRLPTISELKSLIDYSKSSYPTIDTTAFPTQSTYYSYEYYWSSSTYAKYTYNAWYVDFYYGTVSNSDKYNSKYVRCVTGP